MKRTCLYACLAALTMLAACGTNTSGDPLVVKTEAGTIHGFMDEEIYAFAGIPYCKAERFMPP